MTIFDTIRYPIVDWAQAIDIFDSLPIQIQREYSEWEERYIDITTKEERLNALRETIAKYNT